MYVYAYTNSDIFILWYYIATKRHKLELYVIPRIDFQDILLNEKVLFW